MIVDFLRSFHLAPCRFKLGGQDVWVRWYKAVPGALPLPFESAFGSAVWITDYDEDKPPLGMQGPTPPGRGKVPSRYVWRPNRMAGAPPGQHWHGEPDWFLHGIPADAVPSEPLGVWCGRPLMEDEFLAEPSGDDDMLAGQIFADVPLAQPSGTDDINPGPPMAIFQLDKSNLGALSGTINNLTLPDSVIYLAQCAAPVVITGLSAGVNGQLVVLENQGPATLTLNNLDSGSLSANQMTTTDGTSEVLWQGTTVWLLYNLSDAKWRVAGILPAAKAKGGLSTATDTRVSVLNSTGTLGHVLNQRPSEPTGLAWGDLAGGSAGGGDLNYYRALTAAILPSTTRYYTNTYAFTANAGPMNPPADQIFLHPFISPRGGVLGRIASYASAVVVPGSKVLMGIYEQAGGLALEPSGRVVLATEQTVIAVGQVGDTIDFRCDPDRLYWLAWTWDGADPLTQFHGWTTPPSPFWPLFGSDDQLLPEPTAPLVIVAHMYDGTLPATIVSAPFAPTSNVPLVGVRYSS
jgi:hypothetical protein